MCYWETINFILVFLFGFLFGFSELLQRYQPKYTFKEFMAWFYIILNGIVSLVALLVIKSFKGESIMNFNEIEINNILLAGFSGMMILRSSFYSIKYKDENINIGLGTIFQVFLNSVEKKMKNHAGAYRMNEMHEIMKTVNFELAKDELPTLCVSFIENFSKEDDTNLSKFIADIAAFEISNINKSLQLGRYIAEYCDEEILKTAIEKLDKIICNNIKNNIENNKKEDELISELKRG